MKLYSLRSAWLGLIATALVSACAVPPVPVLDSTVLYEPEPEPEPEREVTPVSVVKVDESAMLPLLGYLQLLQRMSPQELVRERSMLGAIKQSPATQLRMAMLLGQPRGPVDLARAMGLLDGVLKSNDPLAVSLNPLARTLVIQYGERLKLEMQNDKLAQQLKENQRLSGELQEKLDALANIERSLPVRPPAAESIVPGALR